MGFFANFKAKRAVKRAQQRYQQQLTEWQQEEELLTQALEIFTNASEGKEPEDQSLVQKDGEFVIWTGNAIFHEAGRTPSRYVGGSTGFSVPIGAGIRVRVGQQRGTLIPGDAMQMDKDQGFVKLTNQRLIFAGSLETTEWAFSKILSVAKTESGDDFLIGVSNRKKTSGLRFSPSDAQFFSRIFAMALFAYEEGISATIKTIKNEIQQLAAEKPVLAIESTNSKNLGKLMLF
jgi:hypothetical protein